MRVKFICLNLWSGGKLFDNILEFLKKEEPDILALQEVYDSHNQKLERRFRSMDVLREKTGLPHEFFSPACYIIMNGEKIENGNAVLSRFPIVDSKTLFFDIPYGEKQTFEKPGGDYSDTPRNMQHAVLDIDGKKISVFNVQGIWGRDGGDNERRLKMSADIVEEIKNKKNVILSGDLNVLPYTKTIGNIKKYLNNVFRGDLKSTFNERQKSNSVFRELVVDYIFADGNLKITDRYCPEVNISDHMPLVAIFEI